MERIHCTHHEGEPHEKNHVLHSHRDRCRSHGLSGAISFPLFTEKDLVYNPVLTGTWVNERNNETIICQKSDRGYNIVILKSDGNATTLKGILGQIGKYWFLDTSPWGSGGDHYNISAHVFSRIWLNGDTLRFADLEGDWLKEMIDGKKLTIPHVRRDGDVILTASTEELQQLVLKIADNPEAFPKPGVLVRQK